MSTSLLKGHLQKDQFKIAAWDFRGGPAVKDPLANAGDTDSSVVQEDPMACSS